jgi:hypothetical protein
MKTEQKVNELYNKTNLINNHFNWELKILEMIQCRIFAAYEIYIELNQDEKQSVLNELFIMDNDMGCDGDGEIETSMENLNILLEDAKNAK